MSGEIDPNSTNWEAPHGKSRTKCRNTGRAHPKRRDIPLTTEHNKGSTMKYLKHANHSNFDHWHRNSNTCCRANGLPNKLGKQRYRRQTWRLFRYLWDLAK